MRKIMLTLFVLTLAACNKPPQDVVPENPAASLPADSSDAPSGPVNNGVVMKVTPVKTDDCEPGKYVADVSWKLPPGVAIGGIELRVESPDGGLLAFQNGREGVKRSGAWVREGTAFFAVDKVRGGVIGQAAAPAYDCQ